MRDKKGRFIKGNKSYWKGKTHSEKSKNKISEAHKNIKFSEATKRKISLGIKKLWQNLKYQEKHLKENSWNWKGDKAKCGALHDWIRKYKLKSELCEFCDKKKDNLGHTKLELANIKNHNYTRNPNDYKWGHRSCHRKFDLKNY
jgi:hypothetical protein